MKKLWWVFPLGGVVTIACIVVLVACINLMIPLTELADGRTTAWIVGAEFVLLIASIFIAHKAKPDAFDGWEALFMTLIFIVNWAALLWTAWITGVHVEEHPAGVEGWAYFGIYGIGCVYSFIVVLSRK